jgi:hypothetical protein
VLIGTPMHEDDILCRIRRDYADSWDILKMPAFALDADDPLGRAIDEPLWADEPGYGYAAELGRIRADAEAHGTGHVFWSQNQCEPRPREGAMFKPGELRVVDVSPSKTWATVRAWDLASTTSGDWTVGLRMSHLPHGSV